MSQADECERTAPLLVRRAAVLGAGTMGSRIAAHLANAGIPVLLLDLAGRDGGKSPATAALEALSKTKPAAFFEASVATLITPGTFDEDLPKLAGCDWVVEAVTEDLAIKTALLERVIPHLDVGAVLTTNTSGLPVNRMAAALAESLGAFRNRFFGTHFFNPPRYMRLLEVIPTADTERKLLAQFTAFADRVLGKQVVEAHDTPNFIANRVGMTVVFTAARLMLEQGLTVEEVDALTGQAIGWPRTGTFRLADLVGIDIFAHVAANFPAGAESGGDGFSRLLKEMIDRKWLGDKTGQGFYKKAKDERGAEQRFTLDVGTMDYRLLKKAALPALDAAKSAATAAERLRLILANDPLKDKAAGFLWPFFAQLWNFAADRIGEVADDAASIDDAMRAGFNWELGPFEMWDAVGVAASVEKMKAMGFALSARVEKLLASGQASWYSDDKRSCFDPGFTAGLEPGLERGLHPDLKSDFMAGLDPKLETGSGRMVPVRVFPGHARVADFKRSNRLIRRNPGASLVDIGDGIACVELHALKNAIGGDVVSMLSQVFAADSEAVRDFEGFVVSSDAENFSVGANLLQVLLVAQEQEWDELEGAIHAFQRMTTLLKHCPRPVVVAPFGMTLGGGAEICLHGTRRQAHAETYMGLVEAGVGLIPGGGGTKEMFLRALDAAVGLDPSAFNPANLREPLSRFAQSATLATALKRSFETIALAKISTSAAEARGLALLAPTDGVTLNRERLLLDAKAQVMALVASGYTPPQPRRQLPAPGTPALSLLEMAAYLMGESGYASEHDQKIARWVAYVLCGGRVTAGTLVSEQYFLDLEREAFLSLCGEIKTQERIAYTLKTGRPLRN